MSRTRPRLLVLGGPGVDAGDVASSLGNRFDVIAAPTAQEAREQLASMAFDAVMAASGDFMPLERDLVGRQSSLLLNAIGEGIVLSDANGRRVWSNDLFDACHDSVRRRVTKLCKLAGARFKAELEEDPTGRFLRPRRLVISFGRGRRFYEVYLSPVMPEGWTGAAAANDPHESPGRAATLPAVSPQVAAVVRDVSARERLARKMHAIERAGQELMHFDVDVVKKMHVAERLSFLETKVSGYAHDLLHFDHYAVRLLNEASGKLDLVMSRGLPPEATAIELFAKAEGNGISGLVGATGVSYICGDVSKDPRYVTGMEKAGSSLTVPLRLFDKTIGVFNVESARPRDFNETDRQFAEIYAHYIAVALHFLNLLVVERYTTRETAAGAVQGEISEPLNDLVAEAQRLKDAPGMTEESARALDRILRDVEAVRRRVKHAGSGPRTLLGIEAALADRRVDPLLESKRVLVADNEQVMRETVRDLLQARGCVVSMFDSGETAIAALEVAAPGEYHLIISDISMGDKTGYEVFASAKKIDRDVPVILMTGFGYDPHHSIVRASQEGLQCVLFKPFQAEKLIEEVKKALATRRT
jgi:CheY-like chemotaxis protein/GAF domain-containing protein